MGRNAPMLYKQEKKRMAKITEKQTGEPWEQTTYPPTGVV